MRKTSKYMKKSEHGSITLFVLLACLFFIFVLIGIYTENLNKLQSQEKNIKQIQENYAKEVSRAQEIYEKLSKDETVNQAN